MPRAKTVYQCSQCGKELPKWFGKCPDCGAWNSMEEIVKQPEAPASSRRNMSIPNYDDADEAIVITVDEIVADDSIRYLTGIKEYDRVMGGGIVKGSVTLLSGDPGIGKSTLLLQICAPLCTEGLKMLYVSGEESARQIKLRAQRLGVNSNRLLIASATKADTVLGIIEKYQPDAVIIDSIQTMYSPLLNSAAGTVSQIRECAQVLMNCAKGREIPLFLVGHVNKEGAIAGPKVLEHMVDTVLYFEGERSMALRILRAVKNRYGSTNEIGVFRMGDVGLEEVENPSSEMLSGRPVNVSGSCVTCIMEGTRPLLAEVQALVCRTSFGTPRRMTTGYDSSRASLILAVLEKRCGYFFGNLDAYLNVVGGMRLDEPAADLAVALALVSNLTDKPAPQDLVAFGEIGLGGELRGVSQAELRIAEARRLGFKRFLLPNASSGQLKKLKAQDIQLYFADFLQKAISYGLGK